MKLRKRTLSFIALFLCLVTVFSLTASAAYYNTYSTVTTLGNANSCYTVQGFASGSTYAYTIKINSDETKAIIYRTNMNDGSTTLMTNGDNGTSYLTYLGHANDMTLCTISDQYYMYIVTMRADSYGLVKLRYSGTTYYKVANYTLSYGGVAKSMSGVVKISYGTSTVNFLFKSGKTFYQGSVSKTATSGTITLTYDFTVNVTEALVNGSTVSNISEYSTQGIGYYDDKIYYPLTKDNVSIVLVYDNISTASGTIYSMDNLSFRITSSAYSDLFEIESVGISNGLLWFATNRRANSSDTTSDGVHYFNGYTP